MGSAANEEPNRVTSFLSRISLSLVLVVKIGNIVLGSSLQLLT